MIEELRRAFERVQREPEDVQRRIAELVCQELDGDDDERTDASPSSPALLTRLEESRRQLAAGDFVTRDELDQHRRDRA